jgi:signal transduction histidine kinase
VQEDLADWMEKLNTMGRGQFDLDVEPQALDMLNIIEVSEMKSILNEAVSNALRHSGAGRARISIKREGNTVHARVWDDGRGFDPSQTALGNGLRNIEKRARKMGASYSIESAPGKGCVVSVTIGPGSAR